MSMGHALIQVALAKPWRLMSAIFMRRLDCIDTRLIRGSHCLAGASSLHVSLYALAAIEAISVHPFQRSLSSHIPKLHQPTAFIEVLCVMAAAARKSIFKKIIAKVDEFFPEQDLESNGNQSAVEFLESQLGIAAQMTAFEADCAQYMAKVGVLQGNCIQVLRNALANISDKTWHSTLLR